ncbi:MAG: hypothetical protein ACNYNX_07770 [Leucobacter sp.]
MSLKTRLWVLVTGLLCALLILYGVLAGLLPQLSSAALTREEAQGIDFVIQAQKTQLARLEEADRNTDALESDLAELELAIPASPEWSAFLRELQSLETRTGAAVSEALVQPGAAPQGVAASPAEGDPAEANPVEASDAAAAPSAEASGSGTESGGGSAAALPSDLIEIPITIIVTGTVDQVVAFYRGLQTSERLLVMANLEIDSTEPVARGTVNGFVYVAP